MLYNMCITPMKSAYTDSSILVLTDIFYYVMSVLVVYSKGWFVSFG